VRILQIDKFLHRQGGAASYMMDLAALQRRAGHDVEFFAMQDPRNAPSTYAGSFAPHVQLEPPPAGLPAKLSAAARMVWSEQARTSAAQVVADFRPDVAHLHNIYHQLTPAILRPLRRAGVPIVMTVHDYKLVCPSYRMLDQAGPCRVCLDGKFRHAVGRRCKDGSATASAALALESRVHRILRSYRAVGRFVCPSRFMLDQLRSGGVYPDRLLHLPHFVDITELPTATATPQRPYIVFAGRLAAEKGVDVLVRAVGRLPGARLLVVGDGPERATLQLLADRVAPGRVTFTGQCDRDTTLRHVAASAVSVLPSRWYENQPMSVLEAMACGIPVIVTALGGAPELVEPDVTGLIVPSDDSVALATALEQLLADPVWAAKLGSAARRRVQTTFSPERHLAGLLAAYDAASALSLERGRA
jgi:glycosyltransferase involved in cell wall biosynthesis